MVDQDVIEAFHLMWDNFPESVMLLNKEREIIASNKAGQDLGRIPGMKCSSIQPLASHQGCKANEALRTHEYTYRKRKGNLGDVVSFWLPIDGYPDYLIHFSVGGPIKYEYTI